MKKMQVYYNQHMETYSRSKIQARAKEDASKNQPAPEIKDIDPFEAELRSAYQLLASNITRAYSSRLEVIDADCKAAKNAMDRRYQFDLENVDHYYEGRKKVLDNSMSLKVAQDLHQESKNRFETVYNKAGRLPIIYIPHWVYLVFAGLIFLGEIPLNALVFQIFGENQVMTWVMAFIIGLSIPLLAHFIGIKWREHEKKIHIPNLIKGTSVFILSLVSLWGISLMRRTYLDTYKDELGLTDSLVQSSMLFFILNVAVLVAAILIAYLSHDPIPGYQELYDDYMKSKKTLTNIAYIREQQQDKLEQTRMQMLQTAQNIYDRGSTHLYKLMGKYDHILKEGQEAERRCLIGLERDIAYYRHENMAYRGDGKRPLSWKHDLDFELQLQKYVEKLDNEAA